MTSTVTGPKVGASPLSPSWAVSAAARGHVVARLPFAALCAYVLSQCFTVPVRAVGPSWAVWPTLSDISFAFLLIAVALARRYLQPLSAGAMRVLLVTALILIGAAFWYALPFALSAHVPLLQQQNGAYDLYRLAQATLVLYCAARVPLPARRRRRLASIALLALVVGCLTTTLTYFAIIPTSAFSGWLPADTSAGPWIPYIAGNISGVGTLGYEHGVTGLTLVCLLALRLHLTAEGPRSIDHALVVLTSVAVFFSGSRAALGVALVLAAVFWLRRPKYVLIAVPLLIGIVLVVSQIPSASPISGSFQRALQLTQGYDVSALSGRTLIWQDKLNYLNSDLGHWLFGSGLGSATLDTTSNYLVEAHMSYLEVVLDGGVFALAAFLTWSTVIVATLARYEQRWRPILWFAIALFISALTQETLYPVAATQQFLAFFLLTVAVGCSRGGEPDAYREEVGVTLP